MSRILVTGGRGFLGARLSQMLVAAGHEVVAADLGDPGRHQDAAVREVFLNVTDQDAVRRTVAEVAPSHVVHAAAIVAPLALRSDPARALAVNVGGTVAALQAALEQGVRRFVLVSSVGVLAARRYEPIDAWHPVLTPEGGAGTGFYGASKVAAESFALAYWRDLGLDLGIVRPSAVYGFGMRLPMFVKPMVEQSVRGEPVRFDAGAGVRRDYTHVDDVASLIDTALDAPLEGRRILYGATGREPTSARELARIVSEVVPGADIEVGERMSDDDIQEDSYRGRIDIQAGLDAGWTPHFLDLRDGIADYARRYAKSLRT